MSAANRASPDVHAFRFRSGGEEFFVVSVPSASEVLPSLGAAELEVARAVLRGASNAAIAKARGRSERTIANQVATLFRKFGVGSRAQLAARLAAAGVSARSGVKAARK